MTAKIKTRKIKGKDYLDVKYRIIWMRDKYPNPEVDNPHACIQTEIIQTEPFMLVKATFTLNGELLATGHGTAPPYGKGQSTWKGREVEKAETAAIGRALAHAGYGTDALEDDDVHLADAPDNRDNSKSNPQQNNESFTEPTNKAVTKIGKDKKPYIVIEKCTFFSRDVFRELGYSDDIIESLGNAGVTELPDNIQIAYVMKGEFRTPVRVKRHSTGELVELPQSA